MSARLYGCALDEARGWVQDNIGLGIEMWHIKDYENARQPFCNEDGSIFVSFNGKIYNYYEIKAFLIKKGHTLINHCDAEIISHMYEEFGLEFAERINGMFTIALFDKKKSFFLLVRDRLGIKPLYYSMGEGGITFSSTLRSLLQAKHVPDALDEMGINFYFTFNYFPCEYTPFKKINKLLPGHYLIAEEEKIEIRSYWQFNFQRQKHRSEHDYIDEFKSIFNDAVTRQSVPDAPVGIFLSGGIDSAGLAYYANIGNPSLKTFSVGFREKTFDERPYSRYLKRFLKTQHYEMELPEDLGSLMNVISTSLDMPVGEGSYVPLFVLSDFAKRHVGVVLSGEGADALFGGCQTYIADIAAKYCFWLPCLIRIHLSKILLHMLPRQETWMNIRFMLELFLKGIKDKRFIPHYFWREIFTEEEKELLYAPDFLKINNKNQFMGQAYSLFEKNFFAAKSDNFLEQALFFDTAVCLPDGMLQRVDMASMHSSLEVRVPFLDNNLVDFASGLPLHQKIRFLEGKHLMHKALKGVLPEKIISRSKHGMSAPVSKWLRSDLKVFAHERFRYAAKDLEKIINREYLLKLFNRHCEGKFDYGRKLWNMLIFFLWADDIKRENVE
ncbi:MAG: asparagine synthase (glutamine-hydrolyzing) [Candidatus Omnitrophica bacterium]|nr:asparagine synthase (glutamine-hydrolyzing) [Candidatus Omnitrophota bacterium]